MSKSIDTENSGKIRGIVGDFGLARTEFDNSPFAKVLKRRNALRHFSIFENRESKWCFCVVYKDKFTRFL